MQKHVAEDTAPLKTAVYPILVALSVCHMLNDFIQSLVPAIYPIIKDAYHLDFGQIGLITLSLLRAPSWRRTTPTSASM